MPASILPPLSSLLQAWVCWFQRVLFLRVGCMRCMWLCTGRTTWSKFCLSYVLFFLFYFFSVAFFFSVLFPVVTIFLFISASVCFFFFLFLCFSLFFLGSGFSDLFVLLRGRLSQCDKGLKCTASDESLLFIVYLCLLSFGDSFSRGKLLPQISSISARIKIPK